MLDNPINTYYQILEEKKKGKTTIDKQFEYNTYIRDFFENNQGRSLEEAITCWKYKKVYRDIIVMNSLTSLR